jgi:hypothetical protein
LSPEFGSYILECNARLFIFKCARNIVTGAMENESITNTLLLQKLIGDLSLVSGLCDLHDRHVAPICNLSSETTPIYGPCMITVNRNTPVGLVDKTNNETSHEPATWDMASLIGFVGQLFGIGQACLVFKVGSDRDHP